LSLAGTTQRREERKKTIGEEREEECGRAGRGERWKEGINAQSRDGHNI